MTHERREDNMSSDITDPGVGPAFAGGEPRRSTGEGNGGEGTLARDGVELDGNDPEHDDLGLRDNDELTTGEAVDHEEE
jgi:hypothetical protein